MAIGRHYMVAWFRRAANYDDPFVKFITRWIALAICARTNLPGRIYGSDAPAICDWLTLRADDVVVSLNQHNGLIVWLANRKGPTHGHTILDHPDEWFRKSMQLLSDHILGQDVLTATKTAKYLSNLLTAVRNNLFHGEKDPNLATDVELIRNLAQVIRNLLVDLEPAFAE